MFMTLGIINTFRRVCRFLSLLCAISTCNPEGNELNSMKLDGACKFVAFSKKSNMTYFYGRNDNFFVGFVYVVPLIPAVHFGQYESWPVWGWPVWEFWPVKLSYRPNSPIIILASRYVRYTCTFYSLFQVRRHVMGCINHDRLISLAPSYLWGYPIMYITSRIWKYVLDLR